MKKILQVLVKDQKAGAESVVQNIVLDLTLKPEFQFKVLILSRFWSRTSRLFPNHTVNIFDALFNKWDTLHTHLFWGGLFGVIFRFFALRTRWIHSIHYASYTGIRLYRIKQSLDSILVFKWADHIHLVSESCRNILPHSIRAKTIENSFNFSEKHRKINSNAKLELLTVGFFRKEKGFERILQSALLLKENKIDFVWTICGDGPLFSDFKKDLKKYALESFIKTPGFVCDLAPFYSAADLYVQTSYSESFGLALHDAFQYRLPILTSAAGNFNQALKNGTLGTVIECDVNFTRSLTNAIIQFTKSKDALNVKALAAFEYYKSLKSLTNKSEKWKDFYNLQSIVFISPITTHATGGIQKQLFLQTKEMVAAGYEIHILQKKDRSLNDQTLQKWSHCQFHQCVYLDFFDNENNFLLRLNGLLFIAHGFIHLMRIRNIKALHALQMYSPTLLAVFTKLFFKCMVVVKVTASGKLGEISQLQTLPFKKLRTLAFKKVNHFLALTQPMKQELIEFGISPSQIQVIPNSVEFYEAKTFLALAPDEAFRILYVGRISTEKSLETLLGAALLLAQGFPHQQIQVNLVGSIYEKRNNYDKLLQITKSAPANLRIYFDGFQTDMKPYYQAAHVFCLTSTSEGMSNALLEAMSHGLPCIVSDISANLALISSEQNGLSFQVQNDQSLKLQLTRLIIDQTENNLVLTRRLSTAARFFIQQNFSVEKVCEKIREAY